MDVATIAAMLNREALTVARQLLPSGRLHGDEWTDAPHARGGLGTGMRVNVRKATFCHFSGPDSARGDMLDLVQYVRGTTKAEAIAWARAWLGLDGADPKALEQRRREAAKAEKQRTARVEEERRRRRKLARAVWLEAQERIRDTPADLYLKARGIDLAVLGRQPRALRFSPRCFNAEREAELPALVGAIDGPDVVAVHRIYLEEVRGVWKKARVEKPKLALGHYGGGCVRLWRGASGRRLPDCPADDRVIVTEGIEDGLVAAIAMPEARVLAAVSLSNMGALWLPEQLRAVTIMADRDPPGSPAEHALPRAVDRLRARGLTVRVGKPPEGVKDLNELVAGNVA